MASVELQIEISPDGQVKVLTKGAKGKACMDWANLMVELLGQEVLRQKTSEYYETEVTQQGQVDVKNRRRS